MPRIQSAREAVIAIGLSIVGVAAVIFAVDALGGGSEPEGFLTAVFGGFATLVLGGVLFFLLRKLAKLAVLLIAMICGAACGIVSEQRSADEMILTIILVGSVASLTCYTMVTVDALSKRIRNLELKASGIGLSEADLNSNNSSSSESPN